MSTDRDREREDRYPDIEAAKEALGGGPRKVSVWRLDDPSAPEHCGNIGWAGSFDADSVRALAGGGTYRLAFYGPSDENHRGGYYGDTIIRIAGPPRDPGGPESLSDRERRAREEAEAKLREIEAMRSEDRIVAALQDMRDFLREVRNPPPQAFDANMFRMMFELVSNAQSRVAPHVTAADPMQMFTAMTEAFRTGLTLGREGGGGGESEGYLGVVERFGLPLLDYVRQERLGNAGAAPAGENMGVPVNLEGAIKMLGPRLREWSEQGRDAGLRADLVLEDLPDQYRQELVEELQKPDPTTTLLGWLPDLAPRRPWVDRFVKGLRYGLGLDGVDGEEPEG